MSAHDNVGGASPQPSTKRPTRRSKQGRPIWNDGPFPVPHRTDLEDIAIRAAANAALAVNPEPEALPPIAQPAFFFAALFDPDLKCDVDSMARPQFSLEKYKRDTREFEFNHGGHKYRVVPSSAGRATIFDKDLLLYATAQLMAEINAAQREKREPEISRTLHIVARQVLTYARRGESGPAYDRLREALTRLKGTQIIQEPTHQRPGKRHAEGFGLIEEWEVTEALKGRALVYAITLSTKLFDAIKAAQVLTMHHEYFRLDPLERRLYELARKFCGRQPRWKCGLLKLHQLSGSRSEVREFKRMLKGILAVDPLPGYRLAYDDTKNLFVVERALDKC